MIKKVSVDSLRVGVYVHDFNCTGSSGNIYIDPGPLERESTIKILRTWGIKEVFIDTTRGLDVSRMPKTPKSRKVTGPSGRERQRPLSSVPLKLEIQSAVRISQEAELAVHNAYQEVMAGKIPEAGQFYLVAERMYDSIHRNSDALTLLSRIREKDRYTLQHSVSVSSYVLTMCRYYEMPESQSLDMAVGALFHDIGKAMVPLEILNKPGKLEPDEAVIMKRHAELSDRLLAKVRGIPSECRDVALHHHERYNGTGYPHGLLREEISFAAQLASVCDVFDALTSERCYKPGMATIMGLRAIYENGGQHFDKDLAYDFIRCIGMYPVGTCVVLADGRSGVVVASTADMKRPVVQLLYDGKKQERLQRPVTLDLSSNEGEIASYSDAKHFGFTHEQLLRKFLLV